MKILLLSYEYPPEGYIDMNVKVVRTFLEKGAQVTVIASKKRTENKTKYLKIDKNHEVYFINKGVLHQNKGATQNKDATQNKIQSHKNYKNILKEKLFWPDPVIDWSCQKALMERTLNINEFDCIVSIASPFTSHIIGYQLAKKYKKKLHLIYGDPWIYETKRKKSFIRHHIEKTIEKTILDYSEKAYLITEYNKEKYKKIYNLDENKLEIYEIGLEKEKIKEKKIELNKKKMNFIYGGSLNRVHRNPIPFLEAINKIKKDVQFNFEVEIYNNDFPELKEKVKQLELEKIVKVMPQISSDEFDKKLNKSDVVILFGNKTGYQIPGKLYKYFESRTHILYIQNDLSEEDYTLKEIEKLKNYTYVKNKVNDLTKSLTKMISSINKIQNLDSKEELEKLDFRNTMKKISEITNS